MNDQTATNGTAAARADSKTVEKVTMADGRSVEFAGKKRMLKTSRIGEDGSVSVQLDFRNGKTINFDVPQGLFSRFAAHGAEQKLGDETAGETDVDDMHLAVEDLANRLTAGEWNVKREGGGFGGTSVLLRALVEFSGRTTEQIKAFLANKTQPQKMALRADNSKKGASGFSLKEIVERLDAEKLNKGAPVDTDALLATL